MPGRRKNGMCAKGLHDLSGDGAMCYDGSCRGCKRVSDARYKSSPHGRAVAAALAATPAGRASVARYNASPEGRASKARYAASPKGKAAQQRADARYNASEHGRAVTAARLSKPEVKAARSARAKRYYATPRGRDYFARWRESATGYLSHEMAGLRYRAARKSAQLEDMLNG